MEWQDQRAKYQRSRNQFYAKYSIGDTWVLDTGWGVLGYKDVVIVAVEYGKAKNVKVRNLSDYKTQWVSSKNLLTENQATQNKFKTAGDLIDYLKKN